MSARTLEDLMWLRLRALGKVAQALLPPGSQTLSAYENSLEKTRQRWEVALKRPVSREEVERAIDVHEAKHRLGAIG